MRRCVIKIGSRLLVPNGKLDFDYLRSIAQGVCALRRAGVETVLVSSGAIATGVAELELKDRPRSVARKQGAAAVGQIALMHAYRTVFAENALEGAQLLLTHADIEDRKRFLNARHTLGALLDFGVVPLVNENDTVSTAEIRVGDNDNLAAMVASLGEADLLVLLSDIDALYTADPQRDPHAERIPVVEGITEELEAMAADARDGPGIGGMRTKLEAAKRAGEIGIPSVIAHGREPEVVTRVARDGERVGTRVEPPRPERLRQRKHWIGHLLKPRGVIHVDGGAARAVTQSGRSLLPSGITAVEGTFKMGDAVDIHDPAGTSIARGLVAYGARELAAIQGCRTDEIETILGYTYRDEVVHRDDLVTVTASTKEPSHE